MFVLVKCYYQDGYDAADHAVIEVTEDLILLLDKRLAQARSMWEEGFFGMKWWDYTPDFIPCGGPESVGLNMCEEDFETALEENYCVRLSDTFKRPDDYAPMDPVVLTVCASQKSLGAKPVGSFYWTGTDKYVGSVGRVETIEMPEDIIDRWAEMINCTEVLAKVRSCRGVRA